MRVIKLRNNDQSFSIILIVLLFFVLGCIAFYAPGFGD
jgi:hypothetical protein